jgi:hypothetical protein
MPTHDVRSGVKGHHQVFAGTRVDFLAERPWIILPPGLAADGTVRKGSTKTRSAEQRWAQICLALQEEARERGTNEESEMPPTADFLSALATMPMPEQVRDMQQAGGNVFGTVDVVITAGEGRKLVSGIGYLKAPRRLADENFPLVLEGDGVTTQSRAVEVDRSDSDPGPPTHHEASLQVINEEAESDNDLNCQPQPKRQARESRVLSVQDGAPLSASASALPHPMLGPAIPPLFPSFHMDIGTSPQSAVQASRGALPLPVAQSAGRISMPFSPERMQVQGQDPDEEDARDGRKVGAHPSGFGPKDMYPDLPPNLHTPQMLPSPYTLHLSDPALEGTAPSDLMRQIPFSNAVHTSSPLERFHASFHGPAFDPSFSLYTPTSGRGRAPFGSSPYTVSYQMPKQARRGSFDTHFPRTNYLPSGTGPPFPGPQSFAAPIPNMLPRAPIPFGHHGSRPPLVSFPPYSYDRRLSGPLPPASLYTVPTKPKRGVSPQKDSGSRRSSVAQASILVSRLIISGLNGTILVDRRWTHAKRIDLASSWTHIDESRSVSPVRRKEIAGSANDAEMPMGLRRSRRHTVNMDTPPRTSPRQPNDLALSELIEMRGHSGVESPTSASNGNEITPGLGMIVPTKSEEVIAQTEKTEHTVTAPTTVALRAIKPMPQRRNASGSSILGVHGPKANPYLFDDPEEILRKSSARKRRTTSPVKQASTPAVARQLAESQPAIYGIYSHSSKAENSSPLSSLHTTPEPDEPDMTRTPLTPAAQNYTPSLTGPMAQLDGSPDRKSASKIFRTPSPTKLSSATTPRLHAQTNTTPMSSASKKRKAQNRHLVKEPRSPNRLQTVSNPPLNEDCVIAYAESLDKRDEQGVLRQVKGERAGVFAEEYVVFAARFFVGEG